VGLPGHHEQFVDRFGCEYPRHPLAAEKSREAQGAP